jgi:Flp pilus assembly protein TadB
MTTMFARSPIVRRLQQADRQFTGNGLASIWWILLAPGLVLTLIALAILIWPELLAYMVASVMLFAGLTLILWSWRLKQVTRRVQQDPTPFDRRTW